jgi:hypothetical protein
MSTKIGSWWVGGWGGGAAPFLAIQPQGRTPQLTVVCGLLAGSANTTPVAMRLMCAVAVVLLLGCVEGLPAPYQEQVVRRPGPARPAPSNQGDLEGLPPEVKDEVVKVSKFQN